MEGGECGKYAPYLKAWGGGTHSIVDFTSLAPPPQRCPAATGGPVETICLGLARAARAVHHPFSPLPDRHEHPRLAFPHLQRRRRRRRVPTKWIALSHDKSPLAAALGGGFRAAAREWASHGGCQPECLDGRASVDGQPVRRPLLVPVFRRLATAAAVLLHRVMESFHPQPATGGGDRARRWLDGVRGGGRGGCHPPLAPSSLLGGDAK